jgi:hypothetical protein
MRRILSIGPFGIIILALITIGAIIVFVPLAIMLAVIALLGFCAFYIMGKFKKPKKEAGVIDVEYSVKKEKE